MNLGPGASAVLAIPVEKPGSNALEWHTEVLGEIRAHRFLSAGEKANLDALLADFSRRLEMETLKLESSDSRQKRIASKILKKFQDSLTAFLQGEESPLEIFSVGGVPVATGWGLNPVKTYGAAPASLTESAVYPADAAFREGGNLEETPPPPENQPFPGFTSLELKENAFLWNLARTLLTALLTFLLLTLAALLFFPGLLNYLLGKAPGYDFSEERGLARELFREKSRYFSGVALCPVEEAELRLDPLPKPETDFDQAPEMGEEVLSVPAPAPATAPAPAPKPPPEPKSPPKTGKGDALVIPEGGDPNDLSFLEGCWESDSDLVDNMTNLPVIYVYCFDKNGRGGATVREYDGKGKHTDTCRTKTTAKKQGKTVVIQDGGALCEKSGLAYGKNTLTCRNGPRGTSVCDGRNSDHKFTSKFKFLGKS
jgi:hypothetical protein